MYPTQMLQFLISQPRLAYGGGVITKKWSESQYYHQYATCYVNDSVAQLILIQHQFMDAFAKLRKVTVSLVMSVLLSVCPHGKTGLPMDGFSLNLIFKYFSNICRENTSLLKSGKNRGYVTFRPINIFDHISLGSSYNDICFRQKLQRKSKHTIYVQ